MIDNRTQRLDLPLPDIDNYLEDDVPRLKEALNKIDQKVATVDQNGKLSENQIPSTVAVLNPATNKLPVASLEGVEASGNLIMRQGGPRDIQIAQSLANVTGGAYVSNTAPPNPFLGMRWYCMLDGRTYIWIIDADSSQWVEENPQSPDWITTSPVVSAIAQATMGAFSHRNLLINGDFSIWQRGNSFTFPAGTASKYTADRWSINTAQGYSAGLWGAIAGSTSSVPVDKNYFVVTPTSDGLVDIRQAIESANSCYLAGKKVTVSLNATTAATNVPMSISLYRASGKDAFVSPALIAKKDVVVAGDLGERFSATFSELTQADAQNGLLLMITFVGVANKMFGISNVQLEAGPVATPFEHRPYSYELSLCQRYCVAVHSPFVASETIGIGGYTTGSGAIAQYFLPVPMRAVPTWFGSSVLSIASQAGVAPVYSIDLRGSTLTLYASQTNTAGQSCYVVSSGSNAGFRGFVAEL